MISCYVHVQVFLNCCCKWYNYLTELVCMYYCNKMFKFQINILKKTNLGNKILKQFGKHINTNQIIHLSSFQIVSKAPYLVMMADTSS